MDGSTVGGMPINSADSTPAVPSVAAILTNWKRPRNIPPLVESLRSQSLRPTIVLVDNSPTPPEQHGEPFYHVTRAVDEYWRFPDRGVISRFAPALLDLSHEYTLFLDDDLLPGKRCVESLVELAGKLEDRFSTIGQIGRNYRRVGFAYEYIRRNVGRHATEPTPVDMTARAHFCVTSSIVECARWWRHAANLLPSHVISHNDDVCLCQSIQRETGHASYLIPGWDSDCLLRTHDMPSNDALSASSGFVESRTKLINVFADFGWKSLAQG